MKVDLDDKLIGRFLPAEFPEVTLGCFSDKSYPAKIISQNILGISFILR